MQKKKKSAISKMMKNAWEKDKGLLFLCIFYTMVAAIYPLFAVILPKVLIGELTSPHPSEESVLVIALGFFLISAVFGFGKNVADGIFKPRMTALRVGYVRDQAVKLTFMDYQHTEDSRFFQKYEKAFNACSSNNNGMEAVYVELFRLPAILLTVAVLAVTMGRENIWILLGIAVNVLATAYVAVYMQKFQYSKKEELAEHSRRVTYYNNMSQDFSYGKDIRLYRLRNRIMSNFKREIQGYVHVITIIKNREFLIGLVLALTLLLSDGLTYGLLIKGVCQGMPIADFSMYLAVALTLGIQMTQLSKSVTFMMEELLYIEDFYSFLEEKLTTNTGTRKAVQKNETLQIEFRDVSFRYPRSETWIFRHLNLCIPKGQKLAIVGINGAGKTTLVKLMTGLFPVTEGEILINDVPLEEYDKGELYSMFSVVFQDVNILAFSVQKNITGGTETVDDELVDHVIKKAGLEKKIRSLKNGKEQMMLKIIEEDGVEFSGGENQKMTIARALYKNGNMVIMDEPTAALDALAEAEIYSEFAELTKGKTAVYISHRLASTKFCDCIALFDRDGLAEYGNHTELMDRQGKYFEMFIVQGKYYREQEA